MSFSQIYLCNKCFKSFSLCNSTQTKEKCINTLNLNKYLIMHENLKPTKSGCLAGSHPPAGSGPGELSHR